MHSVIPSVAETESPWLRFPRPGPPNGTSKANKIFITRMFQ